MAVIKRNIVAGDIEKRIITGAIVNDRFCSQLCRMAQKQYFQIDYAKIVYLWIQAYHRKFKKSPGKEIQNIFSVEQEKMKEVDAELVKIFLSNLSNEYSLEGIKRINYEYLVDQTRDYFRERSLVLLSEKIQGNVSLGRVNDAENEVRKFNRIVKSISAWSNPLDQAVISSVFDEGDENQLFAMSGALGDMGGKFERDWLVAFMGPMKRGKSWWLQELAISALTAGLRVAIFSFEMNRVTMLKRIYKRMVALANKPDNYRYSVMDCEKNQDNTCKEEKRVCSIGVKLPDRGTDVKLPEFRIVKGYIPCTVCRGEEGSKYEPAAWFDVVKQTKNFDAKAVVKKAKDIKLLYGNNLRVMAYPAFSASFDDVENDLEDLEAQEGFVPDVICFDYFDISNPGQGIGNYSGREKADYVWMRGKGLASKRHCLVATVLQSNRKSISKKSLEQEDTAEDIRKLAHVDMLFGLNQTPADKENGIMRISIIVHRHEEFGFRGEVMVLQSLALGQPYLDAEWMKKEDQKKSNHFL